MARNRKREQAEETAQATAREQDTTADVFDPDHGTQSQANAARQEEIAQVYDPDNG